MPPLLINTDYSSEDSEGEREEREDFLDSVSSDDGGEGEREGARMGLSAAQLEETISLHQRNTHRNRVGLSFAVEPKDTLGPSYTVHLE